MLAAGDLNAGFGGGGVVTGPPGIGRAVTVDAGGGVVYVVAEVPGDDGPDLAISRLLPSGLVDGSFGSGGQVLVNLGGAELAIDAKLAPDGKLVVLGEHFNFQQSPSAFLIRYNPNGQRDRNFGSNGFAYPPSNFFGNALDIAANGDIFVAGGSGVRGDSNPALAKLVIDGVLDANFGSGGVSVVSQVGSDEFNDAAVFGTQVLTIGGSQSIAAVQRYSAGNGTQDLGFGSGGATILSTFVGGGYGLEIQSDGKIVALGVDSDNVLSLARLEGGGNNDETFGSGGFVTTGIPFEFAVSARQLAVDFDDRIVVAGDPITTGSLNGLTVNRYTPDGGPDLSFGVGGSVSYSASIGAFFLNGIALLPPEPGAPANAGSDIFVVGGTDPEGQGSVKLVRIVGGELPPFATLDPRNGVLRVNTGPGADDLLIEVQFGVTLVAQLGPDQLFFPVADVSSMVINTGDGPDTVRFAGDVNIDAVVDLGGGNNLFEAGTSIGNFTVRGGGGRDTLFGGFGNDLLIGQGGSDRIFGGPGNDTIDTGSGGDFADGGDGDDSISGGDGADTLFGADGADTLIGRGGDDLLEGGAGNDRIFGETGNDFINGGPGADFLDGGDGNDAIIGGAGNDRIFGGLGNDELSGSGGNDTIDGGAGQDRLFGGDGNDMLMGGTGSDTLDGQGGRDLLSGGDGNDLLLSNDGNIDTLMGDAGVDIVRADPEDILQSCELRYRFIPAR